jgi:protocatechuate 3,4-dioxygenase, beta subunit
MRLTLNPTHQEYAALHVTHLSVQLVYANFKMKIFDMKNEFLALVCAGSFVLHACAQDNARNKANVSQVTSAGATCEGCDAINESPIPADQLKSMVWLPDWNEPGPKLAVNGTVYKEDGKTPAPGVIIYIYHTDQKGIYPTKGNEKGNAKQHGYLRGWMKTDEKGFYKFFTLKPASYPGRTAPAHIHVIIKEPGKDPYWIDEYLFDDDPILSQSDRSRLKNRGGSGVLKTVLGGQILKAERDIYLGRNIL